MTKRDELRALVEAGVPEITEFADIYDTHSALISEFEIFINVAKQALDEPALIWQPWLNDEVVPNRSFVLAIDQHINPVFLYKDEYGRFFVMPYMNILIETYFTSFAVIELQNEND